MRAVKERKRSYMICETPQALESLGVDAELARRLGERFSCVRLTAKTRAAIEHAVNYASDETSGGAEDERILNAILTDVISGSEARLETKRLLGRYGSLLGLIEAIENTDRDVRLGSGVCMRIELLTAVYLSARRAVKVVTRSQALLLFDDGKYSDDVTYALVLDGEFTIVDVKALGRSEILPADAADMITEQAAKYVILSRKACIISDEYYDLATRCGAFGAALATRGIKLIDCIVRTPQGTAALKPDARCKNVKFEFSPAILPIRF